MVFRSIWQGLQNLALTSGQGAQGAGLSDEELKAQAMQSQELARNLMAIEEARGRNQIALEKARGRADHGWKVQVALIAGVVLLGFSAITGWTLVSLHAAGHLHLPWPKIATVAGTFVGTALIALATGLMRKRRKQRDAAATAPGNQAQNGAQDDQNQVGTP
ncbi:hypothetical protein JK359_19815 [Streptomyces actinomycinicus]|uniref:Uncharacterized protein n=1 Tax=Streptomyces actinomycinicus TaxID=1695166 RepID=A0A937ELD8_9ACTN|nr:hypothetical protein [Streptomyces actinomycinicus]MBL1084185.1 hypothetical protein [Streptomyces actinomycinicus]